jgi:hypothetical protein
VVEDEPLHVPEEEEELPVEPMRGWSQVLMVIKVEKSKFKISIY